MSSFDICPMCEGSGFRNSFDGSKCFKCDGLGMIEDEDPDDDDHEDYVSPEDQRRNDAMEQGDELRDRAKDEKQ